MEAKKLYPGNCETSQKIKETQIEKHSVFKN